MMCPGNVKVMEPVAGPLPDGEQGYLYQVKWDGLRMLAFVDRDQVVLQNRRGKIKTDYFPELRGLAAVSRQPVVVDGEVVVINKGKADFAQVLKRNFSPQSTPPVHYIVFDILMFKGKDVRDLPLVKRQQLLAETKVAREGITVIENFADGQKLYARVMELGWEGVVAKLPTSPYVAGKSDWWRKIKPKKRGIFTIIGYVAKNGMLSSVLVAREDDNLAFAGAVGSGLGARGAKVLLSLLSELGIDKPPAKVKGKENWHWVKPIVKAEVEFDHWTDTMALRAPVFKALIIGEKKIELP